MQIVGVSKDSHESHCKFQNKYGLPFALISDSDLVLHSDPRFDTRKEKSLYGRKYMGTMRDSFLLDSNGNVLYEWRKVTPATHPDDVLKYIRANL